MRDPGEKISQTLKREFMEEALNMLSLSEEEKSHLEMKLRLLFLNGVEVYEVKWINYFDYSVFN
jgi:ADP-ribose pyrophosphatase